MRTFVGLRSIALMIATVAPAFGANSNSSTCYYVNGDIARSHSPCFPDKANAGEFSSCCDIRDNGDVCLDTGICLSTAGMTYQGACTDPNWQSSACPHRCPDPQDNWQDISIRPQFWNILMCAPDIYYCRANGETDSDCNYTTAALSTLTSALGLPTQAAAATITETMTLSQIVSSGSTGLVPVTRTMGGNPAAATISCASAPAATHCRNVVAVGAGIGIPLGTLLLASLTAILILTRRRQRNPRGHTQTQNESTAAKGEIIMETPIPQISQPGELPASYYIRELDTKR